MPVINSASMDGLLGCIVTLSSVLRFVDADSYILIQLETFSNPSHKLYDGKTDCDSPIDHCDTITKLCVDLQFKTNNCAVLNDSIIGVRDNDVFTYTLRPTDSVSPNPFMPLTKDWPNFNIDLNFEVVDDDAGPTQLIDRYSYTFSPKQAFPNYSAVVFSTLPPIMLTGKRAPAGSPASTTLTLKLAMYCQSGYYGSFCTRTCQAQDLCSGHYTCDANGSRLCKPGWHGAACMEPDENRCPRYEGFGVSEWTLNYQCGSSAVRSLLLNITSWDQLSKTAYTNLNGTDYSLNVTQNGNNVEMTSVQKIGQSPAVTLRLSMSTDGVTGAVRYTDCLNGAIKNSNKKKDGAVCSEELENCFRYGTMFSEYMCCCKQGRSGQYCEVDLSDCDPNPCSNGGVCADTVAGQTALVECQCVMPWKGELCTERIKICDGVTCSGKGQCVVLSPTERRCNCDVDRTGENCDVYQNPCDPNPCANGGSCTEATTGGGKVSRYCQCRHPWTGTTCTQNINPDHKGNKCHKLSLNLFLIVNMLIFILSFC